MMQIVNPLPSIDNSAEAGKPNNDFPLLGAPVDVETVIELWNTAVGRLQASHAALQCEIQRLTEELAEKNRELARKNRLADLGLMASHVAHEVRNCVSPVTIYLSLLRRRLQQDEELRGVFDNLESAFFALETTVTDLLDFAAHRAPQPAEFQARDLLCDIQSAVAAQLAAQKIRTKVEAPQNLHVYADAAMLRRALLNLTLNAIDAMPYGGELCLTARAAESSLEIEVADSGPGLNEQDLTRLFEPFFSTKGDGVGLGLSIVSRIAEAHGGGVSAHNCPRRGAAFTIHIPRHQPALRQEIPRACPVDR